jgi:hypothetical protein
LLDDSIGEVPWDVVIGNSTLIRYKGSPVSELQEILFLNVISAVIVGETRNSLWNATMVRRRGARQAFTPRAGGSS